VAYNIIMSYDKRLKFNDYLYFANQKGSRQHTHTDKSRQNTNSDLKLNNTKNTN